MHGSFPFDLFFSSRVSFHLLPFDGVQPTTTWLGRDADARTTRSSRRLKPRRRRQCHLLPSEFVRPRLRPFENETHQFGTLYLYNSAANSEAPSGSSGPPRAARKSAPVTPKPTSASKAAPSSPKPVDEPARPRPDPPKPKSAPVQAEAPSLPKSAIRDALQALETGCVPEAYETLSRALFGSDDAEPQEEEEVVHKLNEIALLICRARSTMEENGDAQLVVNDLDKAQTLWTKFGAESNPPKKLETPVKLHHVRLWAFAALDDYKKVLEEAECVLSVAVAKFSRAM